MDSDNKEKRKLKQECKKRKKKCDSLPEANEARSCKEPKKKIRVTEEKQAERAEVHVKKGGEKKKVIGKKRTNSSIVILDLETTGLIEDDNIPDITQIAAVEFNSEEIFCKYVRPEKKISSVAQKLTGINWSNGVLTYQGIPVDFVGIRTALSDFLDWLQQFDDIILVAHYGLGFDFKVMGRALGSCDLLQRFFSKVAALCDSLDIMRDKHPGLSRYSQESLALRFCGNTYTAHNAQDDAIMLQRILKKADISFSDFKKHSIGKSTKIQT